MDAYTKDKYKKLLENGSKLAPNSECLIWQGYCKTHRGGRYGRINVKLVAGGRWQVLPVHRLAKFIELSVCEVQEGLEASHLCHNSLCVKPSHIHFESHAINNNRRFCKNLKYCTGHGPGVPECMLHLYLQ